MIIFDRLRKALAAFSAAFNEVDFDKANEEIQQRSYRYRVRKVGKLWEPQMLYTCGVARKAIWFPLTTNGYWMEPDAHTYGDVKKRSPMSKEDAQRAIVIAKRINEGQLLRVIN